ncbi:MAG: multidrug efflux MFS transporter [Filimonas sp.]|nr:multidrug efflux MFS transporter [Filimonas sp.]
MSNRSNIIFPLVLGTLMAGLDSSIVNVSLPIMRTQFNAGLDDIQWVITAYMISFCVFMPLTSWLKKRIGYFDLYIGSLTIFTIGSLLCGLAPSLPLLIGARVIQAIGGGAITPTAMAILSDTFPKKKLGSVMGWWSLGTVLGPAIGPTLGGILTQYFGWPTIFYINVPIGIFAIWLAASSLSFLRNQPIEKPRFDTRGFILLSTFILLLQYFLSILAKDGLTTLRIWISIAGAGTALFLFIRSAKRSEPLLDLSIFKSRVFVTCIFITIIRSIALFGGLFLLPFLLQGILGYSEVQSGLIMLINSIMIAIFTPLSGKHSDKHGPRNICLLGISLLSLSMFLFSRAGIIGLLWAAILPMIVRGAGLGLIISPITSTVLNSVQPQQSPTASSVYSLMQQLSGSVGIAITAMIHQFIFTFYLNKGKPTITAEHFAIQDGFVIASVLVAIALIFAARLPKITLPSNLPPEKNEELLKEGIV